MTTFKCPLCGIGDMVVKVISDHCAILDGVQVQIKNARIAKCNHCGETSISAKELERWEKLQKSDHNKE